VGQNITRDQLKALLERLAVSQYSINCALPEDRCPHALAIVIYDDGSARIGSRHVGGDDTDALQPFNDPDQAADYLIEYYEALEAAE